MSDEFTSGRSVSPDDALRLAASLRRRFGFVEQDDAGWFADLAARVRPPGLGQIGSFELIREAGHGGQGLVYRARQHRPARDVALKRLAAGAFATRSMRARFEREIEAIAALDHPNIVKVYGVEEVDGQLVVAMQWVEGDPIDRWVDARLTSDRTNPERTSRPLQQVGEQAVLIVFTQVCDAIQHAHQRGVIHRDLKPSNILVDAAGRAHVLDFGLAKRTAAPRGDDSDTAVAALTMEGQFLGTLAWGSPEQAAGDPRKIDTRSDLYALGLVLYFLLTGQMPYSTQGDWRAVLERIRTADPLPPRRALRGERARRLRINGELEAIILKCLAKEPDRRYQSAGELAADVRRLLAGEAVSAKRDSNWYLLRKAVRRHRTKLVAASVVVLLAVIGLWAVQQRQQAVRAAARAQVANWLEAIRPLQANPQLAADDAMRSAMLALWQRIESGEALDSERHELAAAIVRHTFEQRPIVSLAELGGGAIGPVIPMKLHIGFIPTGYGIRIKQSYTFDGQPMILRYPVISFCRKLSWSTIGQLGEPSTWRHSLGGQLAIDFLRVSAKDAADPHGYFDETPDGRLQEAHVLSPEPSILTLSSFGLIVTEEPVPSYPFEVRIDEYAQSFERGFEVVEAAYLFKPKLGETWVSRNLLRVTLAFPPPIIDITLEIRMIVGEVDLEPLEVGALVSPLDGRPEPVAGLAGAGRRFEQQEGRWILSLDIPAGAIIPYANPEDLVGRELRVEARSSADVARKGATIERFLAMSAAGEAPITDRRDELERRAAEFVHRTLEIEPVPSAAKARIAEEASLSVETRALAHKMLEPLDDPHALFNQGWRMAFRPDRTPSQYAAALLRMRASAAALPNEPTLQVGLALTLYRTGELADALKALESATEVQGFYAFVRLALSAMCKQQLGDSIGAAASLRELNERLSSKPTDNTAVAALAAEARRTVSAGE